VGVRVLVDTHVFLWALLEPEQLSRTAQRLLDDPQTGIVLSTASAWEISFKHRLGKLNQAVYLIENFDHAVNSLQVEELPIARAHALKAGAWLVEHRDPFDRILAAQAALEGLPLITPTPPLRSSPSRSFW